MGKLPCSIKFSRYIYGTPLLNRFIVICSFGYYGSNENAFSYEQLPFLPLNG